MKISFYGHTASPREREAVIDCLGRGPAVSDGDYTRRLRELFLGLGAAAVLFTPSCSHALELGCRLLGLRPGDEVLLPSFNFPSAANAVLLAGGVPVLCDVEPGTQNLSVADAARRITPRSRAILAVHYAGVACDMDGLLALSRESGLPVIEDAAQGVDARHRDRMLGTLGRFGAYSFHFTKNFSCGEGGALCLPPECLPPAEIFRDKGTDRSRYIRGEIDRYGWVDVGSSLMMSELCAASLLPQLLERERITSRRLRIHRAYMEALSPLEARGALRLMEVPDYARPNGHIFYVRFPSLPLRERARERLLAAGVDARSHYLPLHASVMGRRLGYRPGDLPKSEAAADTLLRLPIHPLMEPDDAYFAAEALERAVDGP